jgi:membrane-bound ClpP family serine protease
MGSVLIGLSAFSFLGNIGTLQAVLFIVGLLLLIAEAFHPGFGVAGVSGLVLVIVGIFLTGKTPTDYLIMFFILIVFVVVLVLLVLRSAKKGKLKKLILHSAASQADGFSSTADYSSLVGAEGIALTVLRPAGTADFNGQRLDVVTDGEFFAKGSRIKITRTEGRRIVVIKID